MAMANWESVAWDHEGRVTTSLRSPSRVVLKIYKDWVDVEDEAAWRLSSSLARPLVAQVREGHLVYGDVELLALRGPREGVYVVAWSRDPATRELSAGLVGAGVYAYPDESHSMPVGIGELCWFLERLRSLPGNSHTGWSPLDSVPGVFAEVLRARLKEQVEGACHAR